MYLLRVFFFISQLTYLVKVGSNKLSSLLDEHDHVDQTSDQTTPNHQLVNDCVNYAIDLIRSILSLAKQRVNWAIEQSTWVWCSTKELLSHGDDDDNLETHRPHIHLPNIKNRLQVLQRLRRLKHWYASLREYLISIVGKLSFHTISTIFNDKYSLNNYCLSFVNDCNSI